MEETKEPRKYECKYCNVTCSSASNLYEHVVGIKHKLAMRRVCPAGVPDVHSLQQFLDTYVRDEPMLGLEYIVEIQVDKYTYRCELCGAAAVKQNVIVHITGPQHMQKYLQKHHPEKLCYLNRFATKTEWIKALHISALQIQLNHGRKKIQEIQEAKIDNEGPTSAKVAKYSSSKTNLPRKKKDTVESSHTGLNRDRPSSQKATSKTSSEHLERKYTMKKGRWKNNKFLQFRNNDGFFDYLRTFKIENDEDAIFIKHITKNCTKALMKFQEEQAKAQGSLSSSHLASAHGDGTDRKRGSLQSLDKTVSSLSPCAASLCKNVSTQEPGAVGNSDATQIFFSNIKNMEVSEVVGVFEKIAATNPAFKGIDIPNVMKYLQEAGKLKKT